MTKEKLLIVKVGGNVIHDEEMLSSFLKDFETVPSHKILVHGGGKKATEIGEQLGIKPHYKDGRRMTDAATIDLVTMVYGGLLNKQIVARLQGLGCNALGLTGADANVIPAVKRPVKEVDYGFVGDIRTPFDTSFLRNTLAQGIVPVFAALTHDQRGQMLNTNADTIASTLAISLAKAYDVRLMYCFEKKGVLKDVHDEESVIELLDGSLYVKMLKEHTLVEGILPKLHNAFQAIDLGVSSVLIGHAADLLKNIGSETVGTLIIE